MQERIAQSKKAVGDPSLMKNAAAEGKKRRKPV
jgi:hypothetical protein